MNQNQTKNMKKANLLSKAEMKNVMGGNPPVGELGTCTFKCPDELTECTSATGDCERGGQGDYRWIKCDGKKYECYIP